MVETAVYTMLLGIHLTLLGIAFPVLNLFAFPQFFGSTLAIVGTLFALSGFYARKEA